MATRSTVCVVGAGPAGLTAAYRLEETSSLEVEVLEMRDRVGGRIDSRSRSGFRTEIGANTVRGGDPRLESLIRSLDLEDARHFPGEVARRRYVVRGGRPRRLPSSPLALLTTDLFSAGALLRLLREPFVSPGLRSADETVASFVRRRLGPEILDYAVDPFTAGVFAGRPDELVLRHALPALYEAVDRHGSLARAGLARLFRALRSALTGARVRESAGGRRAIFTLKGGLRTLPQRLAERLEAPIRTGHRLDRIRLREDGLEVAVTTREGTRTRSVDRLVYTGPAYRVPDLLGLSGSREAVLDGVPYPPVSVVGLGYARGAVGHPLDGFGVLVPERESFRILGALFSSTLAPETAPEDHVLLTAFVGGTRSPERARRSDEALYDLVHEDLSALLEIDKEPVFRRVHRWDRAIPQPVSGHERVLETIETLEQRHPGLHLIGSYRGGISVPRAIRTGWETAEQIAGDPHSA